MCSSDLVNLFNDLNESLGLSLLCKKWMTGIIKYSSELALLTNPSVNSYKRLVSGYEAPIYACWSDANRSSLIRIPAVRGEGTRTELRNVDALANPYLALAGILAAGLDGIKHIKDNEIVDPVYDNIFSLTEEEIQNRGINRLPQTLYEAVTVFEKSTLLKEVIGEHTFNKLIIAKKAEWNCYHTYISKWELDRLLSK